MSDKVTLGTVNSFVNDTTAVALVNSNSTRIQNGFDNTLSLDGTAPNQMNAALDMNSNAILNLPAPISGQSPLRLNELVQFVGGTLNISPIPANGMNVFNVTNFNPIGTDITASLRAAKNAAVAAGGGIIWVPASPTPWQVKDTSGFDPDPSFVSGSVICTIPSNVFVDGGGTIDFHSTTNNCMLFGCAGSGVGQVATTLSVAAIKGQETITVTSALGLNAGNYIVISGNDANGDFHFWIAQIGSIAVNTITLLQTLPIDWVIGANVNNLAGYVQGGGYRNLNLIGTNALAPAVNGIFDLNTIDRLYQNLTLKGFVGTDLAGGSGGSSGILNFSSLRTKAFNIFATGGGTRAASDIYFEWQSNMCGDDLHSYAAAGFGINIASATDSYFGKLSATGKTIYGRMVKFAGCLRCVTEQVHVIDGNSTGLAIANGTKNCMFGDVLLRGCPSSTFHPGNAEGLWLSDQHNMSNVFVSVDSAGWLDYDIANGVSDISNIVCNVQGAQLVSNPGLAKVSGWLFPFTPTIASQGGTIGSIFVNSCSYMETLDTMHVFLDLNITTAGTGTGYIKVTLPFGIQMNTDASCTVTGIQTTTNKAVTGSFVDANNFYYNLYDGTTAITNSTNCRVHLSCHRVFNVP